MTSYRKMRISVFFALIVSLILALGLSACNKSEKSENKPSPSHASEGNFNQTGLPIVNDPVTQTIATSIEENLFDSGFKGVEMLERWDKETNVNTVWETVPTTAWAERKSTILASKKLPDVISGLTQEEVMKWAEQGALVPLNDYIDTLMPNFKKVLEQYPEYKQMITQPDGKIYSFPTIVDIDFGDRAAVLYLNRKWLEETGRKYPVKSEKLVDMLQHDFTLAEFEELLRDFKKLHPEGVPFTAVYDGQPFGGLYELYGTFGLQDSGNHILIQDEEVVFTADKPQWKEATSFFHRLYKDKLMDQEYFTQDYSTMLAKVQREEVGAVLLWTGHQAETDLYGSKYRNWVLTPPPIGTTGKQMWNKYPKGLIPGTFAITTANKNPEVSVRFQDYLYEPDNSLQNSVGPIGRNIVDDGNGKFNMVNIPDGMTDKEWRGQFINTIFINTSENYARLNWDDVVQMTIDVGALYKPYQNLDVKFFPNVVKDAEGTKRLATLETDITSYVKKMQAKWITDGTIDQDWDGYLKQLDQIGLKEYIEIYSRNYKRISGQ